MPPQLPAPFTLVTEPLAHYMSKHRVLGELYGIRSAWREVCALPPYASHAPFGRRAGATGAGAPESLANGRLAHQAVHQGLLAE